MEERTTITVGASDTSVEVSKTNYMVKVTLCNNTAYMYPNQVDDLILALTKMRKDVNDEN